MNKTNKLASILIFGIIILKLILDFLPQTFYLEYGFSNHTSSYALRISIYLILILLMVFIYKGYTWMKYSLLILTVLSIFTIPTLINRLKDLTIDVMIELLQCLFLIVAQILLFIKPKKQL